MRARIPTLDITRLDTDRDAFVAELGAAYRQWGFAGIRNHGIAKADIDAAYEVFKAFFALPEATKRRYHVEGSGGARGYTAFGVETAKDSKHFDLKEFWHIGREIPDDSPYLAVMPPNLWPSEVPGFRERGYQLYQQLDQLGSRVLSALALHIGLPQDYFVDKTNNGNSILRPLHYPPITSDGIPNVRAGAHGDINFITLLVGASAAGLEVRSNDGEWVPFTADADTIVVNIGDMLQRLTNHVYPSTITAWSTRRESRRASRAIRCRSSSTPILISSSTCCHRASAPITPAITQSRSRRMASWKSACARSS